MNSIQSALAFGCIGIVLGGCATARTTIVNTSPGQTIATAPITNAAPTGLFAGGSTSDLSCSSLGSLGSSYDTAIRGDALDPALFDRAILHFTNEQRCANGLSPLQTDRGLQSAATGHSQDMARLDFFDHNSPVPGKTKFVDRLRQEGVSFTAAAENLGRNSVLGIDSGRPFFVIDRPTCQFSYEQGGTPIAPHTYRTLAREMVTSWLNSPGHRENLLGAQYTRLGSGGAFKENSRSCGDIVATQKFAA